MDEELDPQAFIREVMMKRRGPLPEVGSEFERPAGIVGARGGASSAREQIQMDLEDILHKWASGLLPAQSVQKMFRERGYQPELRRGRYNTVPVYGPTGESFDLEF